MLKIRKIREIIIPNKNLKLLKLPRKLGKTREARQTTPISEKISEIFVT
jgi:hypothetical protein